MFKHSLAVWKILKPVCVSVHMSSKLEYYFCIVLQIQYKGRNRWNTTTDESIYHITL